MNTCRTTHQPPPRTRLCSFAVVAALLTLAANFALVTTDAAAETGGAKYWTSSTGGSGPQNPGVPTAKQRKAAAQRRAEAKRPPVVTGFKLGSTTLLEGGRPLKLRYRVRGAARRVHVRLIVRTIKNKYVKTVRLGYHRTRLLQTTTLTKSELGLRRQGRYKLRLLVKDSRGRRAARAAKVKPWLNFSLSAHRFPVAGKFSFGGNDARFGAGRPGHKHQGQDLTADLGTPIVAPHAGTITWVRYQADGAGYYVVLAGRDGNDYVFMHLQRGSIKVKKGQVVSTGKLLGRVGSTGRSSGPHLHFEIWQGGPWQFGGKPMDPLPLLQSWYAHAPGGAVQRFLTRSSLSRAATASGGHAHHHHHEGPLD